MICELVDNAFDADAKRVWIELGRRSTTVGDDGSGMEDINDAIRFGKGTRAGRRGGVLGRYGVGMTDALCKLGPRAEIVTLRDGAAHKLRVGDGGEVGVALNPDDPRIRGLRERRDCPGLVHIISAYVAQYAALGEEHAKQVLRLLPASCAQRTRVCASTSSTPTTTIASTSRPSRTRASSASSLPNPRHRHRPQLLPKRQHLPPRVQQHAPVKPLPRHLPQRFEPAEVAFTNACRCLDLDADDAPIIRFHHEIHLATGGGAEVEEFRAEFAPGELLLDFARDEGFE